MSTKTAALYLFGGVPVQTPLPRPKAAKRVRVRIILPAEKGTTKVFGRTQPINYAALELLQSWAEEGDEQEQRDTWEYLRDTLDSDRLSDRKLFP